MKFKLYCLMVKQCNRAAEAWRTRQVTVLQLFTRCPPCSPIFMQKRMQISTAWLATEIKRQNTLFLSARLTHGLSSVYPRINGLWFSASAYGMCQNCFQLQQPPLLYGVSRRMPVKQAFAALYVFHFNKHGFARQ